MKHTFWLRLLAAATIFLLLPLMSQAQNACKFSDNFSNPSGWTQVGDLVTIANGAVQYQNGASDGEQRRVYKNIGVSLAANDTWTTDIDFTPTSVGDYGGPFAGHAIVSLTAGTQEPFSNCPDVSCTGYPPTNQDAITCVYTGGYPQSDGNLYFSIHAIEGAGPAETVSPLITANALNTTYFVRLERLSSTLTRLSVFSDAARTVHLPGSPVTLNILSSIEGLNTVQHGNVARGSWYRELTGQVDNLCINWNTISNSTCDFFDDFSSPTGWTQVGSLVAINNGAVEYQNGASDGEQRRVYKNLGVSLAANDTWTTDIDFTPTSVGDYGGPFTGHAIVSLTAGTQEPFNACPDVPCTGYPLSMQDAISCTYGANNPPDGNLFLNIAALDGSVESHSANILTNALNTTYFVRLERISATLARLSVFSDASRTVHLPGSPVDLVIPATIEGLNTVQHGNVARGSWYRELTGQVDNLCINWNTISNPTCDFSDDFSSPTGWIQVGSLVAINNGAVEYQNGASDSEQRRVYKNLGVSLAANDTWTTDIDFTPASVGDYGGPFTGHAIVSLTAGTQEPFNACPDVPCTGYPLSMQDAISCTYGANNPPDGNLFLNIAALDGSVESHSANILTNALNTTYFVRLERLSSTLTRLSVFSDAARTVHLPGSPVTLNIPSSIEGLNTVQHGNVARGSWYRELTGQVDNLCISWNHLVSVNSALPNPADLQLFPNPAQDHISVTWENTAPKNLCVTDAMGQNIRRLEMPANANQLEIPLDGLQPGTYFLVWQDNAGRMYSRCFVKI